MRVVIAVLFLLVADVSCDHPKAKQAQAPQKPVSFRETLFASITPTADGGAYAIGFDSGLWYLRGSEAVKVRFPDLAADSADTFFIALQITPLLDGGAYAHSVVDKSFWHLHEGIAERVTEVSSLSNKPLSGPVRAFPLYVDERQKRLQAEQELQERPSPDDAPPERDE